jgi:hypothetical protein
MATLLTSNISVKGATILFRSSIVHISAQLSWNILCDIPVSHQSDSETVLQIQPWTLPSKSLFINDPSIQYYKS